MHYQLSSRYYCFFLGSNSRLKTLQIEHTHTHTNTLYNSKFSLSKFDSQPFTGHQIDRCKRQKDKNRLVWKKRRETRRISISRKHVKGKKKCMFQSNWVPRFEKFIFAFVPHIRNKQVPNAFYPKRKRRVTKSLQQ